MKSASWAIGIAMAAALAGCSGVSGQAEAELACESMVTERLKHPDVAEFDQGSYTPAEGSSPAVVRGVVRTVNGFNAPVRVTYACQISGDRITVTELSEP